MYGFVHFLPKWFDICCMVIVPIDVRLSLWNLLRFSVFCPSNCFGTPTWHLRFLNTTLPLCWLKGNMPLIILLSIICGILGENGPLLGVPLSILCANFSSTNAL